MPNVYSTEELVQILARERQACMNGDRLSIAASPTGFSPVLDRFLHADGFQCFTAYKDFQATIHEYQRTHQVSGIIWHSLTIAQKTLTYPKVHDQLVGLPSDLALIRSARDDVVRFWQQVTTGMDLYLSLRGGKFYQAMTDSDLNRLIDRTTWATIAQQGKEDQLELILQLGWGQPEVANYRRGWPDSGSESVHAVHPGRQPMS